MPVTVTRPGPWTHRDVTAGGTRFHVALAGPEDSVPDARPLVLLVHGFPECWWAWRRVIGPLAEAGHRVAAVDLRGFGGSDRPPSGYDAVTLASDLTAVVRTLGHERAVVVGAGIGGSTAWALANREPGLTAGIVPVGAPHPLAARSLRGLLFSGAALQYLGFRVPTMPERSLRTTAGMDHLLRSWAGPRTKQALSEAAGFYAALLARPGAAHSALEPIRRAGLTRAEVAALEGRVDIPVLSVQGELDPVRPAQSYARDTHYVAGYLRQVTVPDAGHFPHEEAPEGLLDALLPFLDEVGDAPR